MIGCIVEFFQDKSGRVCTITNAKIAPAAYQRKTGLVRSQPAMNQDGDWYLLLELCDGTFRSIDAYCLRIIGNEEAGVMEHAKEPAALCVIGKIAIGGHSGHGGDLA